jgi:hypothetical protein
MDWLQNPGVAAAIAFALGAIFNGVLSVITSEFKASRDERRAVERERRALLREDRVRVVDDTIGWFRKVCHCLEEGQFDLLPDPAEFAPRRNVAVMGDGSLLLEWKAIRDKMIEHPHGLTREEHSALVGLRGRILANLERQRERALSGQALLVADADSVARYEDHDPTGLDPEPVEVTRT